MLVRGIVGINDWERHQQQDIVINIVLSLDLSKAAKSDNIDDTVNYRTLTKQVISYTKESKHFLVEALAQGIADICLSFDIHKVVVRVEKPGALRFTDTVGVEIERKKD